MSDLSNKTPAQLRAEIAEREAALAAMEAGEPLLIEAREALEFYANREAWNQPPVKTIAHELLGPAYENQSSKVRNDRGNIARAALASIAAAQGKETT